MNYMSKVMDELLKYCQLLIPQSIWLPGVTRAWPFGRSRQWTLNGAVWDNNYYGKCLALHLMFTLYKDEYTLVSSADVSAKCGQVGPITERHLARRRS